MPLSVGLSRDQGSRASTYALFGKCTKYSHTGSKRGLLSGKVKAAGKRQFNTSRADPSPYVNLCSSRVFAAVYIACGWAYTAASRSELTISAVSLLLVRCPACIPLSNAAFHCLLADGEHSAAPRGEAEQGVHGEAAAELQR